MARGEEELLESLAFSKRAVAPPERVEPLANTPSSGYVPAKVPTRKNASEQEILAKYQGACYKIFEILLGAGTKLEIIDLITTDGREVDEVKFHWYTEPRTVSTAYRYARIMLRYGSFYEKKYGSFATTPPITGKVSVLEFVEVLKKEGAGRRTPQTLLYALDWFSVILGYDCEGVRYPRAKRMADDYAKDAPPRNPAPYFEFSMLKYLEEVVLDHHKEIGSRLVAGKLRLCCQAAIRHSDLVRTPFKKVEWCHFQGSEKVMGLRAKVDKTKSGPRPWICSYLGVSRENDGWLPKFVEILMEAHGTDWANHDFFGPEVGTSGTFSLRQSSIEADVLIIKQLLKEDFESGIPTPLDEAGIKALRWHGAKATMPTMMTHFNIPPRVIRHAGAWSKASDSMPDTYLREAQTLVLRAQVEVLIRLRKGEKLGVLEGTNLGAIPKDLSPEIDEVPDLRTPENDAQRAMDSEDFLRQVLVGRNKAPIASEVAAALAPRQDDGVADAAESEKEASLTLGESLGHLTAEELSSGSESSSDDTEETIELFEHFLVVF